MMTQPIQIFKNLTSETTPAGGNVTTTDIGLEAHLEARRVIEMEARFARSQMIANVLSDAIIWSIGQYQRLSAALKANFRLRAAEAQLFRMSDRELADLGLCRADIAYAVREAAAEEGSEGVSPEFETHAAPAVAANRNPTPNLFWAGRA
jgi:uncharacterized protein YjiS (DUF1127 family)